MRSLVFRAIVVPTAIAAAACGGDEQDRNPPSPVPADQRSILGTIDRLQAASRRGDGAYVCSRVFTEDLVRSIGKASGRSCTAEVEANLLSPPATFAVGRDIRVEGGQAVAAVRQQNGSSSKLFFVKRGGDWRIERVEPGPRRSE